MALITGYQAGEFKANEWVILSHLLNVIYYFVRWFNKCIFAPIFFFYRCRISGKSLLLLIIIINNEIKMEIFFFCFKKIPIYPEFPWNFYNFRIFLN